MEPNIYATKIDYGVGGEFAENNKKNIRQVMAEPEKEKPEGFSYGVFMKEDGKSFVHLVFSSDRTSHPPMPQARRVKCN